MEKLPCRWGQCQGMILMLHGSGFKVGKRLFCMACGGLCVFFLSLGDRRMQMDDAFLILRFIERSSLILRRFFLPRMRDHTAGRRSVYQKMGRACQAHGLFRMAATRRLRLLQKTATIRQDQPGRERRHAPGPFAFALAWATPVSSAATPASGPKAPFGAR